MRIDAYNHFFPKKYYEKMGEVGSGLKDMFNRTRAIPCIHDLDERFRVMDMFQDYAQVLSLPAPRLEVIAKGDPKIAEELAKIGNDGLAELVAKYPDRFPGFVAQTPMIAKDEVGVFLAMLQPPCLLEGEQIDSRVISSVNCSVGVNRDTKVCQFQHQFIVEARIRSRQANQAIHLLPQTGVPEYILYEGKPLGFSKGRLRIPTCGPALERHCAPNTCCVGV